MKDVCMKKGRVDLNQRQKEYLERLRNMPDDEIDTSDAPEILDWSNAKRGMFYRPIKRQITLRLDADVLEWFRQQVPDGRGYQTEINKALRDHVLRTENAKAA